MIEEKIPLGINLKTKKPFNVIIADNPNMDRQLLKRFLLQENFNVISEAATQNEALDYIKDNASVSQILFFNVTMNGDSCSTIVKEMKQIAPHLIIIAIGSNPGKTIIQDLLALKISSLLLKPISKNKLNEKLAQLLNRRDLIDIQTAYQTSYINLTEIKIPPIPTIMLKIINFDTSNSVAGSSELEKLVGPDKSLSTSILRIANSSFYGRSGSIKSLKDAITLLGIKTVKNLVILQFTKKMGSSFKNETLSLYMHRLPIVSALVALDLSAPLGVKSLKEDLFLTSLLRKIGMVVLAQNFTQKYMDVLKILSITDRNLHKVEKEVFNTNSIELGIKVFKLWNLPDLFQDIVAKQNFTIEEIPNLTDYDKVTRMAEIISKRIMELHFTEEETQLEIELFKAYNADPSVQEKFNLEYYDTLKDHPFLSVE
ncbi:MAG: HDOD domain-containing protein [Leptospiraceae bacterium]|nr:HDOD domain-containing protein [Leptospiraceae bacterium]MCP5495133.1 HDOD domain-containing protein [Leptospiraceae bacterium]